MNICIFNVHIDILFNFPIKFTLVGKNYYSQIFL